MRGVSKVIGTDGVGKENVPERGQKQLAYLKGL